MTFVTLESNMYAYEINKLQARNVSGKCGPWRPKDIIRFPIPIFDNVLYALMMQMNVL